MGSNIKLNSKRDSNIELFRIITMLVIVAHHFVVNSGLFDILGTSGLNSKSMFAYVFGAWGKTGIIYLGLLFYILFHHLLECMIFRYLVISSSG